MREDASLQRLYVFGAGGHGRETASLAREIWPRELEIVFLVDEERYLRAAVNGDPIRSFETEQLAERSKYVVAIGDPRLRRAIATKFESRGARAAALIHPRAELSSSVVIGAGVIVGAGSVITTNVSIGQHSHVNIACTLSHDVSIGEFVSLSPGVHVAGNVRIESNAFIGAGVTIINGTEAEPLVIGDSAIVAAGACVIRSVEPGALVAGVPAVRKR